MKRIITAIGNPMLNNKLKNERDINIIAKDIQYQEAVFEILKNNKVDFSIMSSNLLGELSINDFIKEIRKINKNLKLIYLLEKEDKKLEKFFLEERIKFFYINNKKNVNNLVEKIKFEINIENKNIRKINNNTKKNIAKIISLYGDYSVGKSLVAINFLKEFQKNIYNKILIMDFDMKNQVIKFIFKNKKILEIKEIDKKDLNNKDDLRKHIKKINNKVDFISGLDLINKKLDNFIEKEKIQRLNKYINILSSMYEIIIIDTSLHNDKSINKAILNRSSKTLFIIEPNLLGIKRGKEILEKDFEEEEIKKESLHIVLNKYNSFSINRHILQKCFKEIKIIGIIKYNKKYTQIINSNYKEINLNKKERKEYKNILKKIT